ncbi:AbrB/MazE/SpoVT family DNA-binding domain-containing protein [Mesorhizobium muleiense]|uniref:Looped-hinge helix DNA binding domain-containing protein, AbrB family n=1 Tax=Mesorhizobium muleiense TaxID=1004279 RepID=A0A1G8IY38_9HYPH|nr:AbrB/MazE/SpoVT family DNA-binding domain-containing protein [Mesorhizobium muleiense]MCF6099815.1 AbrB/MazE/SpoVT family DNA-binding domain-containing protein [Mesorhizobium muleiense]SDI23722.1 looped-hinge helix DNA binding domain-containing protein, AbrB family [Mesorhizobium muleiense]
MANGTEKVGFDENPPTQFDAGAQKTLLRMPAKRERVRLGEGGRFVIPAAMREEMGVKPGEDLILHVENGELRVRSWLRNLRRVQAELSALKKPGESVVDEFLKERREEQRRSDRRLDRLHAEGTAGKGAK